MIPESGEQFTKSFFRKDARIDKIFAYRSLCIHLVPQNDRYLELIKEIHPDGCTSYFLANSLVFNYNLYLLFRKVPPAASYLSKTLPELPLPNNSLYQR